MGWNVRLSTYHMRYTAASDQGRRRCWRECAKCPPIKGFASSLSLDKGRRLKNNLSLASSELDGLEIGSLGLLKEH